MNRRPDQLPNVVLALPGAALLLVGAGLLALPRACRSLFMAGDNGLVPLDEEDDDA